MSLGRAVDGEVVLYHGSSSRNGVRHLARKGSETTLCGLLEVEYNRQGKVNGNKSSSFKGFNSVLGSVCSRCRKEFDEQGGRQ